MYKLDIKLLKSISFKLLLFLLLMFPKNVIAGDYLRINCLPEAQIFTIDPLYIHDDVAFQRSPDDWGKKIIKELNEHNIYPANEVIEIPCNFAGNLKFEIAFAGPEPKYKYGTKTRLWYGDKLLLEFKNTVMVILDNTATSNHFDYKYIDNHSVEISKINITHIAVDVMGRVCVTLNKFDKELGKAANFNNREKTINVNVCKSADDNTGWPITDKNIESLMAEENK